MCYPCVTDLIQSIRRAVCLHPIDCTSPGFELVRISTQYCLDLLRPQILYNGIYDTLIMLMAS